MLSYSVARALKEQACPWSGSRPFHRSRNGPRNGGIPCTNDLISMTSVWNSVIRTSTSWAYFSVQEFGLPSPVNETLNPFQSSR